MILEVQIINTSERYRLELVDLYIREVISLLTKWGYHGICNGIFLSLI